MTCKVGIYLPNFSSPTDHSNNSDNGSLIIHNIQKEDSAAVVMKCYIMQLAEGFTSLKTKLC